MTSAALPSETAPTRDGADLSNWREAPFRRWSFRHLREIIATEAIACDPAGAQPLAFAPKSIDGFALPDRGESLDWAGFMETTATSALMILKDGKVAYEFYDVGMTACAPHIVMSMSKSILGLVAGRLSADGRLDLATPITNLVPEVTATAYSGATLRHLLDMRAGAAFTPEETQRYTAAANWEPLSGDAPADLHSFLTSTPGAAARPHGGPFAYVSANSELVGWAIERATGQTFAQLASELLWKPMGAENDAYVSLDRKGAARCTGGICASVSDLARLGQLVLDGGVRDGREVIAPSWLADMREGGDAQAWKTGEWGPVFPYAEMRYRGGWYVVDTEPKMLFAMGVHGQNLFVDPDNRLVIAKLSFHEAPFDYRLQMLTHQAVHEIRRCLG
jgi:CubicO group peptidase (beta-lactamase class C family)